MQRQWQETCLQYPNNEQYFPTTMNKYIMLYPDTLLYKP